MGNVRPSVTKRQREQKKRERKLAKAEKRAQRKNTGDEPGGIVQAAEASEIVGMVVRETAITAEETAVVVRESSMTAEETAAILETDS